MGYRKYRNKGFTKKEKVGWAVTIIVLVVCFVYYLITGFVSNCIIEWPIRWDVGTCWSEQIQPAKEKAAEKAANFIP